MQLLVSQRKAAVMGMRELQGTGTDVSESRSGPRRRKRRTALALPSSELIDGVQELFSLKEPDGTVSSREIA